LIDGDGDQAGVRDADVGDLPLRAVRRPERYPFVRVQPFGKQRVGDPATARLKSAQLIGVQRCPLLK
jgi:hypothetical protein